MTFNLVIPTTTWLLFTQYNHTCHAYTFACDLKFQIDLDLEECSSRESVTSVSTYSNSLTPHRNSSRLPSYFASIDDDGVPDVSTYSPMLPDLRNSICLPSRKKSYYEDYGMVPSDEGSHRLSVNQLPKHRKDVIKQSLLQRYGNKPTSVWRQLNQANQKPIQVF